MVLFVGAAILFPVTLALRLTSAGAETSQRASEFLYIALAFLVADWLVSRGPLRGTTVLARWRVAGTALLTLIFGAGVILGDPWYARMPGPYRVAAEQLSIEPEGIMAAQWAKSALGTDQRLIADRTNQKLTAAYGGQFPVTAYNSSVGTAYVMYGPTLTADDRKVLLESQADYVVADLRITRAVPVFPYYFEAAEPDAGQHTTPWPASGLLKFDSIPGVDRVFDSGNIVIYNVAGLTHAAP